MTNENTYKQPIIFNQVTAANSLNAPLYLIFIATKPCYIKLASFVKELHKSTLAFLIVDVGQHYDQELTSAKYELDYSELISVHLSVKGSIAERNILLQQKLQTLHAELINKYQLGKQAIPVVSGDTLSAGIIPLYWYLISGIKSIHIEAGLRSFKPLIDWTKNAAEILTEQKSAIWEIQPDAPFPEGIDTRLASISSQLFFAPVKLNLESLQKEGYDSNNIVLTGSLSADAIEMIQQSSAEEPIFNVYPILKSKQWLRVDVHRRENMTEKKLQILLKGLKLFQVKGGNVILVLTNSLNAAIKKYALNALLDDLKTEQTLITPHWPKYAQVIDFITSEQCLGIYTDSGGMQEEANILGIRCCTFRFNTDRPETISEGNSNVLVPPVSESFIGESLEYIFLKQRLKIGHPFVNKLYSTNVGERITDALKRYEPALPVIDEILEY